MPTLAVILHGRKIGAIGITYELPAIYVEAETREQAIDMARTQAYEKYEHISGNAIVLEVRSGMRVLSKPVSDK